MATAHDVAAYVLRDTKMSAMKLQKLVYYSQAWSLAWDGRPLFDDEIQAWAHGPVVRSLYAQHRGKYLVERADFATGDAGALEPDQAETIDIVLAAYGSMSAAQLSALTHAETPWKQARKDLGDGDFGSAEISHASMRAFYTQLSASGEGVSDAADVNFPSWAS